MSNIRLWKFRGKWHAVSLEPSIPSVHPYANGVTPKGALNRLKTNPRYQPRSFIAAYLRKDQRFPK